MTISSGQTLEVASGCVGESKGLPGTGLVGVEVGAEASAESFGRILSLKVADNRVSGLLEFASGFGCSPAGAMVGTSAPCGLPLEACGPSVSCTEDLSVLPDRGSGCDSPDQAVGMDQAAYMAVAILGMPTPIPISVPVDVECGKSVSVRERGSEGYEVAFDWVPAHRYSDLRGVDLTNMAGTPVGLSNCDVPLNFHEIDGRAQPLKGEELVLNTAAMPCSTGTVVSRDVKSSGFLVASSVLGVAMGHSISDSLSEWREGELDSVDAVGLSIPLTDEFDSKIDSRLLVGAGTPRKLSDVGDVPHSIRAHSLLKLLQEQPESKPSNFPGQSMPDVFREDAGDLQVGSSLSVEAAVRRDAAHPEFLLSAADAEKSTSANPSHSLGVFTVSRAIQERTFAPMAPESVSSPVDLSVWRELSDVVRKVSSEDPSHLSVNLRLSDGSVLDLDVRVVNSGVHATFKTESRELLAVLESRWSQFMEKNHPDLRVISSTFHSDLGFDVGSNQSENRGQRETREDFSAASVLSDHPQRSRNIVAPAAIPPSNHNSNRLSIYA